MISQAMATFKRIRSEGKKASLLILGTENSGKKKPRTMPGLPIACVQQRSVPRDHRSRSEGIVEASSDDMIMEAYIHRVCCPAKVGVSSEINVQVFQLRGPIRSEFLLETCTNGPAHTSAAV